MYGEYESFSASGDDACIATTEDSSVFKVAKSKWDVLRYRLFIHCVHVPSLKLRRREVKTTFGHIFSPLQQVVVAVDAKQRVFYVACERALRWTKPIIKASIHQLVIESYDSRTLQPRKWGSQSMEIARKRSDARVIVNIATPQSRQTVTALIDLQISPKSVALLFGTPLEFTGRFETVENRTNVLSARRRSHFSKIPLILTFDRATRMKLPIIQEVEQVIPRISRNDLNWNHYDPSALAFVEKGSLFRLIGFSQRASNHEGSVGSGPPYLFSLRAPVF